MAGSSPLARGTPDSGFGLDGPRRFIPARAGNTCARRPRRDSRAVHPRSRGEHSASLTAHQVAVGSSPLARGTRRRSPRHRDGPRFIPARAGNTRSRSRRIRENPVHPRSRGEHSSNSTSGVRPCGSSPLARGTRAAVRAALLAARFIPARAGNTSLAWVTVVTRTGSSPLARGTPPIRRRDRAAHRFIPARAGNTTDDG